MYDAMVNFVGDRHEFLIENVVRYEINDKYARFFDDQDNRAYIPLRNVTSIYIKPVRNKEDQNDTESGDSTNSR